MDNKDTQPSSNVVTLAYDRGDKDKESRESEDKSCPGCEFCDVDLLRKNLHGAVDSMIDMVLDKEDGTTNAIAWSLLISTQEGTATDSGAANWAADHILVNKLRRFARELESRL